MAVKAINNTAGPNGLVPTLLVYRVYLRISNLDLPTPSITEQAAAIRKAIAKMVKLQATERGTALYYYITAICYHIMAIYHYLLFFASTVITKERQA